MGNGQQMKNRIRRSSHSDIECHGIQESLTGSDTPGQYTLVSFFVIFKSILHNQFSSVLEELGTVLMSSYNRSVAGKRQPDGFIQTVHRVCRKHTRTTTTSRTSISFYISHIAITYTVIGRFDHSID